MKWWLMHLAEYTSMIADMLEPFTDSTSFTGMTLDIGNDPMDVQPARTYRIRFKEYDDAIQFAAEWDRRYTTPINEGGKFTLTVNLAVHPQTKEHVVMIDYRPKRKEQEEHDEG